MTRHSLLCLMLVACGAPTTKVAPSSSTSTPAPKPVASTEPAPMPAEPPSGSFTIREGPAIDAFPSSGVVLRDGRVLVAAKATYSTSLGVIDEKLNTWKWVDRPKDPEWINPLSVVALDADGAFIGDAYIGPNPSHRGGARFDAAKATWTEIVPFDPTPLHADNIGSAIILEDGRVLVLGTLKGNPPKATTETYVWSKDEGKGHYEALGALEGARIEPTLTRLRDGRVLVVGGKANLGRAASVAPAEIFNPKTNKWTSLGELKTARQGHTATLLADGRVAIAGGNKHGQKPTDEIEVFDPKDNKFTVATKMLEGRTHHTATLLPDGRVIFIGGVIVAEDNLGDDSGYTRLTNGESALTAELWDPKSNRWSPVIHVPTGRYDHATVLLPSGKLLVMGGRTGTLVKSPERTEIWEPSKTETVRPIVVSPTSSPLPQPTLPLADGRIFGIGTIWDPAKDSFTEAARPKTLVPHMALVAPIGDGDVLAVDHQHAARFRTDHWEELTPPTRSVSASRGWRGGGEASTVTSLDRDHVLFIGGGQAPWGAEVFSAVDDKFFDAGTPLTPRHNHTATLLEDGRVLIVGGRGEPPKQPPNAMPTMRMPIGPLLGSCELWDPKKKSFVGAPPLKDARMDHTALRLPDGRVLVAGGRDARSEPSRKTEIWSPKTKQWTSAAPMASGRAAHTATLLADGRVLVLGGESAEKKPSTAEIYDAVKDAWTVVGTLPDVWWGHQAFALRDGRVLVTTKHRSMIVSLRE